LIQDQWSDMEDSEQKMKWLEFMQYGDGSLQGVNLLKAMELVDDKEPDITWADGSGGEEMNTQEICISQDPEHIAQ
jgi:hypothetical protein